MKKEIDRERRKRLVGEGEIERELGCLATPKWEEKRTQKGNGEKTYSGSFFFQ